MPRITIELLRKRVEHNDGEISSVEELALHQEKIEKLENLDKWCRKLKILLLHNNLIGKIENLSRLKELEYVNLALNNIERIENLEGCETLRKLDLTLNFIGEISSVQNLRENYLLENLYLTGNPCTDFPGYRKFVIHSLPQLKSLDGIDVTPTERLVARQELNEILTKISEAEREYRAKRRREQGEYVPVELPDDPNNDEDYWNKVTPNTPEIRTEMTLRSMKLEEKSRNAKSSLLEPTAKSKKFSFFHADGRPKNINQGKISFSLNDDEENRAFILDLAVPKFMDSSLIEADIQPQYARFTIKGKIFQIVLPEEIQTDSSVAQRSQTTGHLLVIMPKLVSHFTKVGCWNGKKEEPGTHHHYHRTQNNNISNADFSTTSPHPVGTEKAIDWRNIIERLEPENGCDANNQSSKYEQTCSDLPPNKTSRACAGSGNNSKDSKFVDNPDVPPLI